MAYKHIKWGLILKLLLRTFSWRPWIPGTTKLNSIIFLFKCALLSTSFVGDIHTPIILLQSDLNCSENLNTSSEPWRCQEFDSEVRLVPHGCPELHQDCRGFVSIFWLLFVFTSDVFIFSRVCRLSKSRVTRRGEICS